MFDSKQTLTRRLADAVDLMIDFATLGEYGFEPVGRTRRACAEQPERRRPPTTRAIARGAQCNLHQEAGFRGPGRAEVRVPGL